MEFEIYKDAGGEFRWRLQATNNEIVADSAESYKSKQDCIHGISLVQSGAAGAKINDKT